MPNELIEALVTEARSAKQRLEQLNAEIERFTPVKAFATNLFNEVRRQPGEHDKLRYCGALLMLAGDEMDRLLKERASQAQVVESYRQRDIPEVNDALDDDEIIIGGIRFGS